MSDRETHLEYAQRIGAPRAVKCDVELGHAHRSVYYCRSHDYPFNGLLPGFTYAQQKERCPMSRLEEWRQRAWEYHGL